MQTPGVLIEAEHGFLSEINVIGEFCHEDYRVIVRFGNTRNSRRQRIDSFYSILRQ